MIVHHDCKYRTLSNDHPVLPLLFRRWLTHWCWNHESIKTHRNIVTRFPKEKSKSSKILGISSIGYFCFFGPFVVISFFGFFADRGDLYLLSSILGTFQKIEISGQFRLTRILVKPLKAKTTTSEIAYPGTVLVHWTDFFEII